MRKRARPGELGKHVLDRPVVSRWVEERVAGQPLGCEQRVGVGAQVLDPVLAKPALHLTQGVAVFLDVAVLVAQPGLAAGRLGAPLSEDLARGSQAEAGQPHYAAAEPLREWHISI